MFYIRDIISKKKRREVLTEDEMKFVVQGYFKDEISEAQMAALMTAMHMSGVNEKELLYLVDAVAETGDELEFYRISNRITDIHSLGGISDKITLILISILHSLGLPAAKVIGRELGMEDRLLAIPGYKLEENIESFKQVMTYERIKHIKKYKKFSTCRKQIV